MAGTDLAQRSSLDLTRAPNEQWNAEMVKVVAKNVFRGKEITESQLYYCLSVAESLSLNPMIGEIYFLPSKSRDGAGPAWTPYVGRNGLVRKATDRGCYYESDTVHANDKLRVVRRKDGTVELTHSYSPIEDRGDIVGAYAFLHDDDGRRKPAFFYAEWEQYRPTFDKDWKWEASPWGNQSSAMIEKCAMIGAGRKRLDLGNVLADGEVARVQQMQEVGPRSAPPADVGEFDFSAVTDDAGLAERLRVATSAEGWPAAKCELILRGRAEDELRDIAERLERTAAASAPESAPEPEPVDAEVVPDGPRTVAPEDVERLAGLDKRKGELEDVLNDPHADERQQVEAGEELEQVDREIAAVTDPLQGGLFGGDV